MNNPDENTEMNDIPALQPGDKDGLQFVCYADCCSGIPGTAYERTFARINAVLQKLKPQPEFICFPGDEIRGLTLDEDVLCDQWRYWLETEMGWLDRDKIPLYHTTGNHTAYDETSRIVFRHMLHYLPKNGPEGQEGLSYYVRRGTALLVFANTLNHQLGGEGFVETEWLDRVLTEQQDAKHKLVFGHHPVFPVNGFSGPYQRQLETACGIEFWNILLKHGVAAYFCSHMLAFDVQVRQGILQILTAGAGTAPLMPEDSEYHHLVQAAVDDAGLRYQTVDDSGHLRECLDWPPNLPSAVSWNQLGSGIQNSAFNGVEKPPFIVWRFTGRCGSAESGKAQTMLSLWDEGNSPSLVWIGLHGVMPRIAVLMRHTPGRSPHLWLGPELVPGAPFDVQIALHPGMGPGGVLWRQGTDPHWTSMDAASPWGPERLTLPSLWCAGSDRGDAKSLPFRGENLSVTWTGFLLDGIYE